MSDVIGKNTPNSAKLRGVVDEIERIAATIKELQESRTAIYAQAKADGFSPEGIRYVVRVRKMKPHDRVDAETTRDIYLHAMGMEIEPPLFRQLGIMARDNASSDKLLESFKLLVPPNGEIIVTVGGKRMRLWRDKEGEAHAEDYTPPNAPSAGDGSTIPPRPTKKDVPACTADEAEALGEQSAKDNRPVIENPFPYGDARRPRWDAGWRKGSGNDGMGGPNP